MALQPLSAHMPLGQFDGYDSEYLTLKGGEVVTFKGVSLTGTDKAAFDAFDGYDNNTNFYRPTVTKTLSSGNRPLFLADDGTANYGTLFGTVVGGVVGQVVTGGTVLGPHTATGSGKVTLWDKPGLYAVTLDAVDTTASTGLVVGNSSLTTGSKLYATTAGLLTPNTAVKFEDVAIARFVEFSTGGSLVTTPNTLVAALNSPSSNVNSAQKRNFTSAVIWYVGAGGGA